MIFIISAIIGIFSISLLPVLPSATVFFSVIFLSIVSIFSVYFTARFYVKTYINAIAYCQIFQWVLWLVFASLLGLSYGFISAKLLMNNQLSNDLDNKVFIVDGVVAGLVKHSSTSIRFDFIVTDSSLINEDQYSLVTDGLKNKKIRLSYYQHNKKDYAGLFDINTGDNWQLLVKLKRPRGFVNPMGFDYQGYLLSQRISATGYIKISDKNKKLANKCINLSFNLLAVACVRDKLNTLLVENFSESKVLGLLAGLLIGEKNRITNSQWQTLKDTGTIHLLAISGLHIGLAAAMGYCLGKFFMKFIQLIMSRFSQSLIFLNLLSNCRWLPSLISMLFAVTYSLLAGFSLPTQRALIMLSVFHLGLWCSRNVRPWSLFVTALLGIALVDPLAIYSQGFWLSFLAVGALVLVFNGYVFDSNLLAKKSSDNDFFLVVHRFYYFINRCLRGFLKAQWSVVIGLVVPSIILLKGVSGLGFIANFIAIPLVTLITVPLLLLSLLLMPVASSAAVVAIDLANTSIEILFFMLQYLQGYGVNFWDVYIGDPTYLSILIASVGIVYLLLPRGIPVRWLGVFCLIPLLFSERDEFLLKVTAFDVGQGTAVIVETPNSELIYDTGKKYSDSFNIGEHVLAPYLKNKKRQDVDRLMISHNDLDHAGGVEGLLKTITVKKIYAGELNKNPQLNARQCVAGQQWRLNNIHFAVVWPTLEYIKATQVKSAEINATQAGVLINSNNLSCVLLIRYQSTSILLAGDIEKSIEKRLIKRQLIPKNINVLLAPHHGSQTSSHKDWIDYLSPEYVIFSTGYKNSYGHPHKKVIARYKANNATLLNTATDGAITVVIDVNNALRVNRGRWVNRHYWHDGNRP
jgi:competence protein ComEC